MLSADPYRDPYSELMGTGIENINVDFCLLEFSS